VYALIGVNRECSHIANKKQQEQLGVCEVTFEVAEIAPHPKEKSKEPTKPLWCPLGAAKEIVSNAP
jgi:hypothetical protein